MVRNFLAVALVAGVLACMTTAASASFWGRPYPYGYTGWGPCIRWVPVQTNWGSGLAYKRVYICRYHRW